MSYETVKAIKERGLIVGCALKSTSAGRGSFGGGGWHHPLAGDKNRAMVYLQLPSMIMMTMRL